MPCVKPRICSVCNFEKSRLWERFELSNINDRIENLYQHFRDEADRALVSADAAPLNLEAIRRSIREDMTKILGDLEKTYNAKSSQWKQENVRLQQENNNLKARLRHAEQDSATKEDEKILLDKRYKSLRASLDELITDATKKNQEKMKKQQAQIRTMEKEKSQLSAEMKANKRKHDEDIAALNEKYDSLNEKHRKLNNACSDLQAERDKYYNQYLRLQQMMAEEKQADNERLNGQMNALQTRLDEMQTNYDLLHNKHIALDNEHQILQEKYALEKKTFTKVMENAQVDRVMSEDDKKKSISYHKHTEEMKNLRASLGREYAKKLEEREKQWEKAKNQSIKTLDDKYKELENALRARMQGLEAQIVSLKENYADSEQRVKQQMAATEAEIAAKRAQSEKLRKAKADIRRLEDEMQGLQVRHDKAKNQMDDKLKAQMRKLEQLRDEFHQKLDAKHQENIDQKTELQQYQILWRHFFGLDVDLQDQINEINENLDKFENYHHIESPIPKKKRRVVIESLQEFQERHPNKSPLLVDAIPSPKDEYQRFELRNVHNMTIELKGFSLVNQEGAVIPLDSRQIKPGGNVGVALKKRSNADDIVYDRSKYGDNEFCTFRAGEVLHLVDSFGEKVQIFPREEMIIDNLSMFDTQLDPVIMVNRILNTDADFRAFEFKNAQNRRLRLKNCFFKNKKGTFRVAVPSKSLPKRGVIRLIVTDNHSHPALKPNDIKMPSSKLPTSGIEDDVLFLCDNYGNELQLYDMSGINLDGTLSGATGTDGFDDVGMSANDGDVDCTQPGRGLLGRTKENCFIM